MSGISARFVGNKREMATRLLSRLPSLIVIGPTKPPWSALIKRFDVTFKIKNKQHNRYRLVGSLKHDGLYSFLVRLISRQ